MQNNQGNSEFLLHNSLGGLLIWHNLTDHIDSL